VGTTIVGGMLVSTVLNLFFIPALYVILQTLLSKFSRKKPHAAEPEEAQLTH
jgi:HAE1 family hydrophobic/amphiphilic exporter-1